jgi:hypothetical protein
MLHLALHDVLEAFGLYLQQPFLKQVRQGGWRELKGESGTREQRQASRFIRQELESSVA